MEGRGDTPKPRLPLRNCYYFQQQLALLTLGAHAQRGLQYLGLCVCVSVKSHLTYGASVRPENAVKYSAGNEGRKICGVFSENAPLLRLSGAAVAFHIFRWPFFFIAKVVRMRIGIHSYACRTAGEYPACPTIVNNIQPCPKRCRALVGARTDSTTPIQQATT